MLKKNNLKNELYSEKHYGETIMTILKPSDFLMSIYRGRISQDCKTCAISIFFDGGLFDY